VNDVKAWKTGKSDGDLLKLRQFLPPEPESSPGATICGVAEEVPAEDVPAAPQVSALIKINAT
jgi:hypothetical protein